MKKKTIIDTILTITIFILAFIGGRGLAICSQNRDVAISNTYTRDAVVISRTHDAIHVEDITGNFWRFDLCDDYWIGDCIQMTLCDNGTDDVTDDVIVNIIPIGTVE